MLEDCFRNSLVGDESGKIIYIAGPITGDLYGNLPVFFEAEKSLRFDGHTVFNPARIGGARSAAEAIDNAIAHEGTRDWVWYMKRGIIGLMRCNTIAMLPGWSASNGATVEHNLARDLGYGMITLAFG